jgi:hypothetical protein
MKSKLYFYSSTAILLTSVSCRKWPPENRIEGSWMLSEVQKRRFLGNETIKSGFEDGTFTFNENRTAAYTTTNTSLRGNWEMRNERSSYRDDNGNWQKRTTRVLIVRLYNFNNNQVMDWYFDRFDFRSSGTRLFAFSVSPGYNYRYCFTKK